MNRRLIHKLINITVNNFRVQNSTTEYIDS